MTGPPKFNRKITVDPALLRYEPFCDRGQVRRFDCGIPDLDDFLNTHEVEEYEREKLGSTWLVYYQGELVAYYTIGTDSLRTEYIDEKKVSGSHVKQGVERVDTYPSLKIGRLAVQSGHQDKGIGFLLVRRIAAIAHESQPAVRLLTVNAKKKSVDFYLKCGFEMTREVKRERGRRERTMYLDLLAFSDEIEADPE